MICVTDFAKRESMRAAMVCTLRASGYRMGMPMVEIPPSICDTVRGELREGDDGVLPHLSKMIRKRSLKDTADWRDLRGLVERHWVYRRKTYAPFASGFGSTQPASALDQYIDQLVRDSPHTVKGLTTCLYQIAKRVLARRDVSSSVPVIRPLGSGATPMMRRVVEDAFGGKFYDDYGTAEFGPIAFACQAGQGMHIFADQFIVEVLDSKGNAVSPGQLGEVVITDLTNHAMPLFRYRVGDLGRIVLSKCSCGSSAPRIQMEGRVQDSLLTESGSRVTSHQLADLMYQQPEVDEFQLVEKRTDMLDLKIAPTAGQQVDLQKFEKMTTRLAGSDREIRVRKTRTIHPEPGGKFRWVKKTSKPVTSSESDFE